MKTYKELKENLGSQRGYFSDLTGSPLSLGKGGTVSTTSKNNKGMLGALGNFAKNNKGMLGAVGAGVVGLGLLTGLIRGRQGIRDNAPQRASTPPPSLSVTQAKEPDIAVGIPATRVSKAVRRIDPSVKPIDNRTTQA
jgi:hypothetical protein